MGGGGLADCIRKESRKSVNRRRGSAAAGKEEGEKGDLQLLYDRGWILEGWVGL